MFSTWYNTVSWDLIDGLYDANAVVGLAKRLESALIVMKPPLVRNQLHLSIEKIKVLLTSLKARFRAILENLLPGMTDVQKEGCVAFTVLSSGHFSSN